MTASTRNIIAWILQGLLALAFIASGGNKLLHLPATIDMFGKLGLPGWFAYLIGGAEVAGGIGLLIPGLMRLAAAGLAVIMVGAAYMHFTKIPGGPGMAVPSLVLLVLLAVVVWLRRPAPVLPAA